MSDRRTAFDAITKDKPTLAGFLRSLPCIEAPWDAAFQKRYCSSCTAENCDACPNEQFRNNPEWWLSLPPPSLCLYPPGLVCAGCLLLHGRRAAQSLHNGMEKYGLLRLDA